MRDYDIVGLDANTDSQQVRMLDDDDERLVTYDQHELQPSVRQIRVYDASAAPDNDDDVDDDDKLSYWGTVMHLLIGGMSPTLLNLPATFHQVGYAVGFVGCLLVVLFYARCMHTLVACERRLCRRLSRRRLAYWQVLHYACATGPPRTRWLAAYAKPLTHTLFVVIWGGGNCTYVLLAGENVKAVLAHVYDCRLSDREVIALLTVPLVALCWIPNLKAMVTCSAASNMLNVACIGVIVYVVSKAPFPSLEGRTVIGDASQLPYFLAVIFLTVNGTGLILSLKNQMWQPEVFGSRFGVLNASYGPTGVLYATFGLLCYLRYGDQTKETVILNLPADTFGCVVRAMYALAVVLFYPLVTYVTFEILRDELMSCVGAAKATPWWWMYGVRTVNAFFSIVLAFIVPNIALFVSLIGSVCVALDSIILPAAVECLVRAGDGSFRVYAKITVMMMLGVALMVVGFRDSYAELLKFYIQ